MDGSQTARISSPSLRNWPLFAESFRGDVLTDFSFVEHSFGLTPAGAIGRPMLEWIARGLRKGIVTTRYPRAPSRRPRLPRARRGAGGRGGSAGLEARLPDRRDRGRRRPHLARPGALHPLRALRRGRARAVRIRGRTRPPGAAAALVAASRHRSPSPADARRAERTLKRSIHIRHVDAGSDGGEEWEIQALTNPYYDIQRLGLFFTLSPRHADILLVTGGVSEPMRGRSCGPGRRCRRRRRSSPREPTPARAASRQTATRVAGGVDRVLPVDVYVPGSPPSPIALLHGLLLAAGSSAEEAA